MNWGFWLNSRSRQYLIDCEQAGRKGPLYFVVGYWWRVVLLIATAMRL
ncbi:MAG: hypothetical protein GY862_25345 [Gammaproteobacteria bacterium]|nr:hypothetical protein [Gammaproteobacteria bacterium]